MIEIFTVYLYLQKEGVQINSETKESYKLRERELNHVNDLEILCVTFCIVFHKFKGRLTISSYKDYKY